MRVIGALFIIAGICGIAYGAAELLIGMAMLGGILLGTGLVMWVLGVTS